MGLFQKEKNMQVQVHTDNHIEGTDGLGKWVTESVSTGLSRFKDQITRVEVHFSDESSGKKSTPLDKQCTLEVRLVGHQPLAVKHLAANLNQALDGANEKMIRLIDNTLGRVAHV
jgi:ribosome-associated translation inhibitor RaiA